MTENQATVPVDFLVSIAREVWRTKRWRGANPGVPNADALNEITERMTDNLREQGIELFDPVGQAWTPGLRYEVGFLEPGEGTRVVSVTLIPGVKLQGELIASPTVGVSSEGTWAPVASDLNKESKGTEVRPKPTLTPIRYRCPYCESTVRIHRGMTQCPVCAESLPVDFVHEQSLSGTEEQSSEDQQS